MTAPVFLLDPLPVGDMVRLAGAEGRHAVTVRRLVLGERVDITDGGGHVAQCRVARVGREALELTVECRRSDPPPAPRLVIVQALAKGGRAELAVELLAEVGVDEIVPWAAARSIVRWSGDRGLRSLGRWRATAREAAKQSRRTWWPRVADLATTAGVAQLLAASTFPIILHEGAHAPLTDLVPPRAGNLVAVVGPEGGVTDEELATFAAAGGRPVRLGPTILRTSSAGVAAAALILARSGRWA